MYKRQDYPYTKMREDLSILVLRAKYDMAKASVEEKKEERMRETIDEYCLLYTSWGVCMDCQTDSVSYN